MTVRFTGVERFDADMKKFAKKVNISFDQLVRNLAFRAFDGVTLRTPVDTGWARANWKIRRGQPDTSLEPKEGFEGGGAGEPKAIAANAKNKNLAPKSGSDDPVWVTNSVPYIGALEDGHSKQMDKGFMVKRTFEDLVAQFRAEVKEAFK